MWERGGVVSGSANDGAVCFIQKMKGRAVGLLTAVVRSPI